MLRLLLRINDVLIKIYIFLKKIHKYHSQNFNFFFLHLVVTYASMESNKLHFIQKLQIQTHTQKIMFLKKFVLKYFKPIPRTYSQ